MNQMLQCELLFLGYLCILGLIAWFVTPHVLWILLAGWKCQCQTKTKETEHDKKV